jgi:hypothetical protein
MRVRSGLALATIAALIALTALAHASPPDPSWIAGLYDDGDLDDVVVSVTGGLALDSGPTGLPVPAPVVGPLAEPAQEPAHLRPALSSLPERAPPAG